MTKYYAVGREGFSFVELMVVIALISALSAIVLPSFLSDLPEKRLKDAAIRLYADLQKARMLAVKENKSITVRFVDNPGNKDDFYYFDLATPGTPGVWDPTEYRKIFADIGAIGYGMGSASANSCYWNSANDNACLQADAITFTRLGVTSTDAVASIFIGSQNLNVCYSAAITNYGSVRLRRFSGSAWE